MSNTCLCIMYKVEQINLKSILPINDSYVWQALFLPLISSIFGLLLTFIGQYNSQFLYITFHFLLKNSYDTIICMDLFIQNRIIISMVYWKMYHCTSFLGRFKSKQYIQNSGRWRCMGAWGRNTTFQMFVNVCNNSSQVTGL